MVAENVGEEALLIKGKDQDACFIELQTITMGTGDEDNTNEEQERGGEFLDVDLVEPQVVYDKPWLMIALEKVLKLHYGWWVIVAGGLGIASMSWGGTYSIGFFMDYMLEDLQISRTEMSLYWSLALVGTAIALPVVGRAIDQYGPRVVLTLFVIPYTLSFFSFSYVRTPLVLPVVFCILRLGMESVGLIARVTINQWWSLKRGRAMSVAMGIGGIGLALPSFLKLVVNPEHWRQSFFLLTGILLVILILYALLVVNNPESYGKFRDGWQLHDFTVTIDANHLATPKVEWTWRQALRTPTFWVVSLCGCVMSFFWSGFNFHYVSICHDRGLSISDASSIFLSATIGDVLSLIGVGVYYDWLRNKHLFMATFMVVVGGALTICLLMSNTWMAIAFGGMLGMIDALSVGPSLIIGHFYGRTDLGTLNSILTGMAIASIGFGAVTFGWCKDTFGTYSGILLTLGVICGVLFLILLVLKEPILPADRKKIHSSC